MPHRDRWAWSQLQLPPDVEPQVNTVLARLMTEIEPQLNTMLALTDFTKENGATRIAPGSSHLPDDAKLHQAMLAYESDESISDNVAVPYDVTWGDDGVVFVSLDHAMWFHRPVDMNDWLFVDQRPVTLASERGVATADVWNRSGDLVATFTQEALLRF